MAARMEMNNRGGTCDPHDFIHDNKLHHNSYFINCPRTQRGKISRFDKF